MEMTRNGMPVLYCGLMGLHASSYKGDLSIVESAVYDWNLHLDAISTAVKQVCAASEKAY